jgi:hypothetical protein
MAEPDNRSRLKQWLESGEASLHPLTFPQRELWETSPVAVADCANHICGFIEIRGAITPVECEAALRRVIDRQEAMRISFLPGKERPLQMVRATSTPLLEYRELSPAEARPEPLEEVMREVYRKPFDLLQGPLHRVEMLRRGAGDHVLAFSIHHAIADGWSLGVFVQDLSTAYVMGLRGLRKAVATGLLGLADSLPPVPQTHSAWAAAERAFWQPAEIERRAGFWKSRLQGARPLWSGHEATARGAGPLARSVCAIPADLTRGIRDLAARRGATLFSTLLAAFQLALWKWHGATDIVVGTPVANRNKEVVRQTMGYFAGIVPLRGQIDPARSFAGHLESVHATAVDSFAHAMPFAELARVLDAPARPGAHSVFDIRFALQNHPVPDVELPRISTRLHMRSTGTARFDLGCEITEAGAELEVVWLHRPAMFSLDDLQRLDRVFRTVLAGVCRNPEGRADTVIS